MKIDPVTGLSLPETVLESKLVREAWTQDDTKHMRRLQKQFEQDKRDIDIMFHCRKCDQMVVFGQSPEGQPEMVCSCKRRVII